MTRFQPSPLLRNILLLDGVSCIAAGLLMAIGASFLAGLLALPGNLLLGAGVFLIVFGAGVLIVARQQALATAAVMAIIACNIVWAVESVAVLLAGAVSPNAFGIVFVLAQAFWVAALASVQIVLLKRDKAARVAQSGALPTDVRR